MSSSATDSRCRQATAAHLDTTSRNPSAADVKQMNRTYETQLRKDSSPRHAKSQQESTKIKRTTLSTTVAELYALMKCYGTCQMLRGLIKDIAGHSCEIRMRTDANNLVTTASTTHVPEQTRNNTHDTDCWGRKHVQDQLQIFHTSVHNGV